MPLSLDFLDQNETNALMQLKKKKPLQNESESENKIQKGSLRPDSFSNMAEFEQQHPRTTYNEEQSNPLSLSEQAWIKSAD